MKNLKYLLILFLAFSLIACGGESNAKPAKDQKTEKAKKQNDPKKKQNANNKKKNAPNKKKAQNKDLFFNELAAATGISEADYKKIKSIDNTYRKDLKAAKNAKAKKAARTQKDASLKDLLGNNLAKYKKLNTEWSNILSTIRLKSKLSLTDDQLGKLKPLRSQYAKQLKGLNKKKDAAKYSSLVKELESKSLAILNDKQKTSYQKIIKGIKKNQLDKMIPFQ